MSSQRFPRIQNLRRILHNCFLTGPFRRHASWRVQNPSPRSLERCEFKVLAQCLRANFLNGLKFCLLSLLLVFVQHPPPEAQRLIHCGKICDDGSTLGSYVSKRQNEATFDGTPHTFHLVLSSTTTQLQRTMSEPPKPTAAQRVCLATYIS